MANEPLTPQSVLNKASDDKFLLVLNVPLILKNIDKKNRASETLNLDTLQFAVEGMVIPDVGIPSKTIPFGGQSLNVTSYARTPYQTNRIKFTVDNRFNNYWVLWKWLDLVNDAKLSTYNQNNLSDTKLPGGLRNIESYQTDITVYALDEFNRRVAAFTYHKAFITLLGGVNYNYQAGAQILSYFEFDYSQFTIELL
jgi:hypothetical protein